MKSLPRTYRGKGRYLGAFRLGGQTPFERQIKAQCLSSGFPGEGTCSQGHFV
jgi:hypothetical protein